MKITIEDVGKPTITYDFPTCCNTNCQNVPTGHVVMALCPEHCDDMILKLTGVLAKKQKLFIPSVWFN